MANRQPENRKGFRSQENGRSSDRRKEESEYSRGSGDRREAVRPRSGERAERRSGRGGRFGRDSEDRREDFSPRGIGERKERPRSRQGDRFSPAETEPGYRSAWEYEYRPDPRPEGAEEQESDRILCGRNPIREALRSGREIEKILVQKGELSGSARQIVQEARARKIMVQETDKRRLDDIAPHHQGMIAFAAAYAYAEVEEMLQVAAERGEDPFLIILDGVTDPHNLGAVIRTAECAGAHGVIIPQHRSVGLTPAAVKASAGAIEHMKIARVTNLNRTIDELKRSGIWTYAVTMEGKDFEKVDFHGGTALVIGAEGEGISRLTAEKCDLAVSLPMKGALDSLNASVAAGIIMYRVLCCRRRK